MIKEWTVDEFIRECENLARDEYGYDYAKMPDSVCNGHKVGAYPRSWTSVVIDGCVVGLGVFNEKWPNGNNEFVVDSKKMTSLEYVRLLLERPVENGGRA